MIGSWRAASPRGGACRLSARRSSIPEAALAGAGDAAVATLGAGSLAAAVGAGCASASGPAKTAATASSRCAPDRFASMLNRESWQRAGLTGRRRGRKQRRAQSAKARCGPRRRRHLVTPDRFVESIIHEAVATPHLEHACAPAVTAPPSPPASGPTIAWPTPARARAFAAWLDAVGSRHGLVGATLRPASSDASFRRYFRVDRRDGTAWWSWTRRRRRKTCGRSSTSPG